MFVARRNKMGKTILRCSQDFGALIFVVLSLLLCTIATPAFSQTPDGAITVRLGPEVSLRDLSAEYLGSPDLWPIILRINGFRRIIDLAEDQELMIPASQAKFSASALQSSLEEIQRATEAGAQIFAPKLIKSAIDFRDDALSFFKSGSYGDSIDFSNRSITTAESAGERSTANRDVQAEALLNDRQGWVEGQKPSENSWNDRPLNSVLTEAEKIRTLSRSTAQIVFRDASRIRLNANSQAIIERLRADPLKRSEEAKISIVQGDFYAELAEESTRNKFQVNLSGVDTTIESGQFWLSQSDEGAKFTNYDIKPVSISSQGETLVLGRNEGVTVNTGSAPGQKIDVVDRVELASPTDTEIVFLSEVDLSWNPVEGAQSYWLEIAFDREFNRMRESLWGVDGTTAKGIALAPGAYYWRVAALDVGGLPGRRSQSWEFDVQSDIAPPFLAIRTPEPGAFFREDTVIISGESEPNVAVLINGVQVASDSDGRFSHSFVAQEGANAVEIIARDSAGNESAKSINFVYLKDGRTEIIYGAEIPRDEDRNFLTASDTLNLSGIAEKSARISVVDGDGGARSSAFSDSSGAFALNVPLLQDREDLELQVTTSSGYRYTENISVIKLTASPKFALDEPLPRITDRETLELKAHVDVGAIVTMNDQRAEVQGDIAIFSVKLLPGANLLTFVTTNRVGLVNVEKWTVILDAVGPDVVEQSVSVTDSGGYTVYAIKLKASDASGLAKTAHVTLVSGTQEYSGVLRFNRARKRYSGGIEIPTVAGAAAPIITVKLVDIAGNETNVSLVQ